MDHEKLKVAPGKKIRLSGYKAGFTNGFKSKENAKGKLAKDIETMISLQDKLYAFDKYAALIILQAMDAAGKDGVIKHVMSGLNPQGCQVYSFKAPSQEELDHDFLWRCAKNLPRRGHIGIFNRSYYEEVLVVKVHSQLLASQKLPQKIKSNAIWKQRYKAINDFEQYLADNGIVVIKFFLNISKDEQKKRFLARIDSPGKNWKFSSADIKERDFWDGYIKAYEEMLKHTSTKRAPWYIIPADHKWFSHLAVADIIVKNLKKLKLSYPKLDKTERKNLISARKKLLRS